MYNAQIKNTEDEIPDITHLATSASYTAKINEVKEETRSITNLSTNASLNVKINEIKNEIPSIINLATTTAVTADKNEIPDHSKYIMNREFNKLTAENFTARLKQANLATKGDIADFVKKTDFDDKLKKINKKVISNKSQEVRVENELKNQQDKIEILQTYDSSFFIGQSYFF